MKEQLHGKERPEYDLAATGEKMRKIRVAKALSVEDVRRYMKFGSVQAIYKWEAGKCFPSADNLLALAELYGVNPTEILVKQARFDSGIVLVLIKDFRRQKRAGRNCISHYQISV